ncbi:TRAP transporter fused permease subunit [Marinomonas sp. S3726]|uniref:TRAP transporter permease n=1 Tax=Marinomonas sp. S3726 TaxID=579484 RepID=UPI00069834F4|nr:TRAP transporter fused permease subunit [Marinomonas sp. S3726]
MISLDASSPLKQRLLMQFVFIWAFIGAAFHLYSAFIGYLEPRTQRSIHLFLMVSLIFLLFPGKRGANTDNFCPTWSNIFVFLVALLPFAYSWLEADRINFRLEGVDDTLPMEMVMGTIATLVILEGIRRAVSPVLAGLVTICILYLFVTDYMPGVFHYRPIGYGEIIETLYLATGQGIFGSITGIAATMVAIFIAFGAFMESSGVGRLFTNGGELLAGRYSGGPAKVSVVTSAFFGTMSGSASSNVFTTGSFTIPMMKRIGYRPQVASGIETAASVGGQSAPPIMGAGAFIMSEMTNTPYSDIIVAAVLGSFCFFSLVFISVHLEAKKNNLKGMSAEDLPKLKDILKDIHLLVPIVVLVVLLMMHYSPHTAALYSIVSTLIITFFRKNTRFSVKALFNTLYKAGANTAPIAIACAGAGIIVAVLTKTGLVVSIGGIIADVSGGNLWMAAFILMFVVLIMGMGVPTTAAYVITAAVGTPMLINDFGVPILAAHMFVFYFAILADATPPVSIASYAAASIARCNPLETGLQASRMAIAGYFVGLSYLFVPEMRMEGEWQNILGHLIAIIGGLTMVAGAIAGYLGAHLHLYLRIILPFVGAYLALNSSLELSVRVISVVAILSCLILAPKLMTKKKLNLDSKP